MQNKMLLIAVAAVAVLLIVGIVVVLTSGGLSGKYYMSVSVGGEEENSEDDYLEFSRDGSVKMHSKDGTSKGKYKIKGDTITITDDEDESQDFKLSKDRKSFSASETLWGSTVTITFKKKKIGRQKPRRGISPACYCFFSLPAALRPFRRKPSSNSFRSS
jgi:hypothetical protein